MTLYLTIYASVLYLPTSSTHPHCIIPTDYISNYIHTHCIIYPPSIHLTVPRFTTREQREALAEWLDWVAAKEDVWFVTGTQTLLWMTDPTPLTRLNSFEPWQCEDKPVYLLSNVSIIELPTGLSQCKKSFSLLKVSKSKVLSQLGIHKDTMLNGASPSTVFREVPLRYHLLFDNDASDSARAVPVPQRVLAGPSGGKCERGALHDHVRHVSRRVPLARQHAGRRHRGQGRVREVLRRGRRLLITISLL